MEQKMIIEVKEEVCVSLTSGLKKQNVAGLCQYFGTEPQPAHIILNKDSENINEILIHECIHSAIFFMIRNQSMEKLAHKLNKREDFVELLAEKLSNNLKFIINENTEQQLKRRYK